jgi:hypothetical protein
MLGNNDEQPPATPQTSPTAAAPTSAAPSPSPQPTSAAPTTAGPTASTVLVPETFGDTQSVATGKLTALGLTVSVLTQEDAVAQPGTVLATNPPAGSVVPAGSEIVIIVAKAIPNSPAAPSPTHEPPHETQPPTAAPNRS